MKRSTSYALAAWIVVLGCAIGLLSTELLTASSLPQAGAAATAPGVFGPPNVERAPWIRAGRGVGDAAVKMVFPHRECGVRVGGYSCSISIYVLLKDGRIFSNIGGAPRDFDATAATRDVNNGHWRRRGRSIVVDWSAGSPTTIDPPFLQTGPAPADYRIAGTFAGGSSGTAVDSYGTPSAYIATNRVVTFKANGTFAERAAVGGYGEGGVGADSQRNAGRYRIEGYTIELAYADGRRDNQLFSVINKVGGQAAAFVMDDLIYGKQ